MAFAQGSRSRLTYIVENTFGTTPGSPSMVTLPFNTHSMTLNKTALESPEIRSDRQRDIFRHGARQIEGDIEVDFRADDFDDLLESAMFSAFDTDNYLRIGTTLKHLSIEDGALDIDQYRLFTGCTVNTFAMNVSANAIVTATFGIIGKDMTVSGTSVDASPTASSGNQPYDGNNFIGNVKEGGVSIATITSIEFSLENGITPAMVIGSTTTPELGYGRAMLSGTISAYFNNATLMNKFINETESEIEFTLDDNVSGNAYRFWFPRVKYNGADVPVSGEDHRMISIPFVGLLDSVEQSELVIQKL